MAVVRDRRSFQLNPLTFAGFTAARYGSDNLPAAITAVLGKFIA